MATLPSAEYWRRRAEEALIANEKSVLEYEKDLKRAYEATSLRIAKELEAFYHKYATDNEIDLATARQRLDTSQLAEFKKQQEIYLAEAEKYGADPNYIQYLKELSAKAYVTKLQEIQANIRHSIETLTTGFHNDGETLLKEGYEDSFYKTLFDVQKQFGFGVDFTAPGDKQLEKAVRSKWLESNFSDRVWANKNALINQLTQLLPQEFVRGQGSRAVAKTLAAKLGNSYNNSLRLIRTEMNYISNQATMDAYKKSGVIEEYEFLATLDGRTSDICREMDGKVFKVSQKQVGVNMPPLHPNCRSTTVPYFPEDDLSEPNDRIARDENGKSYFVGKAVTYQEWVNNYAEATYAKRVAKNPKAYTNMNKSVADVVATPLDKVMEHYKEHAEKWMKDVVLDRITEEEAKDIANAMKELIDANDFCMRVTPQVLGYILEDGKFKNQFETGTSNGLLNKSTRRKATKNLFGADVDSMKPEDFEIYGYLGLKNKDEEFNLETPMYEGIKQYGSIAITFKKDRLNGHVTYTGEDSLSPALDKRTIAGNTSNPSAAGISSWSLRSAARSAKTWKDEYELNPFWVADEVFRGDYIELQYTRKPTLEDIEIISLPKRMQQRHPELLDKLDKLKIPYTLL